MSDLPERIWVYTTEMDCSQGQWINCESSLSDREYVRADLVDALVEIVTEARFSDAYFGIRARKLATKLKEGS